jgi:hypothetical protein
MPIWRGTTNSNWGTASNWLADGSGSGVPTALTDAVFDNLSPACTVNVAGVCRNLNFNSGTGYTNTITMTNGITVGSTTAATAASVTLSSGMGIAGAGAISTRTNTTVTLTSNGRTWPNNFGIGTVFVGVSSSVTFVGNWTIDGTLTIGTGGSVQYTFVGAINITCNGNLAFNIAAAASNAIRATAGSITTIIIAGNSTWSSIAPMNVGVNININAPGKTVNIGDNCCYGGLGTAAGSNFTYTAGTVITSGTFHFLYASGAATYTVNVNGSSSTSATTTNTSGINFSNLSLRTNVLSNAQSCTLSSPVCVVNDFSVTSYGVATKGIANLLSNNAYLNKSVTINGYSITGTTTFRLQGTGTWSENNTLTAGVTGFGMSNPFAITGNYTLGSFVGSQSGSITYTSGSLVTTGFGFRLLGTALNGFGSGGILIETLWHTSNGALASAASTITINDTQPVSITNMNFDGFAATNAHTYAGTAGWTCGNFNYQHTTSVVNASLGLVATTGLVYTVTQSFIFRSYLGTASAMVKQSGAAARTNFTLKYGASQDVFYMGATNIDSSPEQTVWTRKGALSNTLNWNLWDYPKTRFSTFVS